jgi:hypothetical protein
MPNTPNVSANTDWDPRAVPGNGSLKSKEMILTLLHTSWPGNVNENIFGAWIARNLSLDEVSMNLCSEEPSKPEAKVVFGLTVTEGMPCSLLLLSCRRRLTVMSRDADHSRGDARWFNTSSN